MVRDIIANLTAEFIFEVSQSYEPLTSTPCPKELII